MNGGQLAMASGSGRGRGTVASVLDEKWPLLWKENLEALVDCHLWLVGFDLAEVRVQCDIKCERIAQHEFGIEARTRLGIDPESGPSGRGWRRNKE